MNKQGNVYTIIYIIVLVVVVGTALAFTSISLRDRQQANADADKMRQILASVLINPEPSEVIGTYRGIVKETLLVNDRGECVGDDAFGVNVAEQSKLPAGERLLPVYVCTLADGAVKYVLPVYGAGLWGPIWGYVSVDADGSTVYGAYFAHQGETPGLGAEIEKPAFSSQFQGKTLFKNDVFLPVAVVKAGQKPAGDEDYVDGISGGTITSKGVGAMIDNCLSPYAAFLSTLNK
ncbi:NADH:ubiquinone reductase (Na(+)-transporting) subunit C [Muribaculum intestinale]|uniref:NADH:ubiquinone reductase (Na(+)-transporting) subunit C n=1 Tax=Muribaculum intestinale TaxID=1796646 RepID=UPI001B3D21C8|nr:NADH:ubiquinone reductase (Na(+)-transporting) subunit C [Muribaculum intestinale]MBP3638739.1 NADH:ubiquinone reductase (Na(+)-transporting) subunit C [Muribaculaceae bacterium]